MRLTNNSFPDSVTKCRRVWKGWLAIVSLLKDPANARARDRIEPARQRRSQILGKDRSRANHGCQAWQAKRLNSGSTTACPPYRGRAGCPTCKTLNRSSQSEGYFGCHGPWVSSARGLSVHSDWSVSSSAASPLGFPPRWELQSSQPLPFLHADFHGRIQTFGFQWSRPRGSNWKPLHFPLGRSWSRLSRSLFEMASMRWKIWTTCP